MGHLDGRKARASPLKVAIFRSMLAGNTGHDTLPSTSLRYSLTLHVLRIVASYLHKRASITLPCLHLCPFLHMSPQVQSSVCFKKKWVHATVLIC